MNENDAIDPTFGLHEGHRITLNGMPKKVDGSAGTVDAGIITFAISLLEGATRNLIDLHHVGTSDPFDPPAPTLSTINGVEVWLPMGSLTPEILGSAEFLDVTITVSADADLGVGVAPIEEKITIRCIPLGASSLNVVASVETPIPGNATESAS